MNAAGWWSTVRVASARVEDGKVLFDPGEGLQQFSRAALETGTGFITVTNDRVTVNASNGTWMYRIVDWSIDGSVALLQLESFMDAASEVEP